MKNLPDGTYPTKIHASCRVCGYTIPEGEIANVLDGQVAHLDCLKHLAERQAARDAKKRFKVVK